MAPELLSAVGGFFFRRAGAPVEVIPVKIETKDDPITRLTKAAAPMSSIIWLYDVTVRGTAASEHPRRISQLSPRYVCHDFGKRFIGSVACAPGVSGAGTTPGGSGTAEQP